MSKVGAGGSLGEYHNHRAVREIEQAYSESRRARRNARDTVAAMTAVIEQQVARRVYISDHLIGEAIDVRIRNLSHDDQELVIHTAKNAGATYVRKEHWPLRVWNSP